MSAYSQTLPSLMGLGVVSQEINTGVSTAGAAAGAVAAIVGASSIIPIIGPVVAGVTALVSALGIGNGCGGTCTEATQVVNQVEPLMKQNLAAAQQVVAQNGCLTAAEAQQLEANYAALWQQVLTGCGQVPAPGGTQCIADRQQGGKYPWATYYLAPIQQMPICAGSAASSTGTNATGVLGTLTSNPLLLAGLAVAAFLLLKKG